MRKTTKLVSATIVASLAAAGVVGTGLPRAGPASAGGGSGRGELVAIQPLRSLSTKDDVDAMLTAAGFGSAAARHGVDSYQLVYRTVDTTGRPTIASGMLALPRGGDRQLTTVSYTHGTEINRTDAPSMWRDGWATAPTITFASAGFAAVAPDYLGLGLGPGPHPYLDIPTETTASMDLLRAARTATARTGRTLHRDVLVTGFSQGATAALGLARGLQAGTDPWFRLRAAAPVAGQYDMAGVGLPALVNGTVPAPWNVGYSAYILVAFNRLHHLYNRPDEVFTTQYAPIVEGLFDGVHDGREMVEALPGSLPELLTPHGMELLSHPSGPFAAALATHDSTCRDWRPTAPVKLFLSLADEQVPAMNSEHCRDRFAANHIDAPLVDVGALNHNGSVHLGANILGVQAVAAWFDTLR